MDHHKDNFQIHLGGIIDLLSNHLYSSPEVYLRELLQNSVDAIQARRHVEPQHEGELTVQLMHSDDDRLQLIFEDNGIGLTLEETHKFLSTIGQSSKRSDVETHRQDFIGQFGIGLLSCFMVSEEIVMLTRSAKTPDAQTIQWRGKADGTYETTVLDPQMGMNEPGTHVFLSCKPEMEPFYDSTFIHQRLVYYGNLLPIPVWLIAEGQMQRINPNRAPWLQPSITNRELMAFGESLFDEVFFDCIELDIPAGGLNGVAYIMTHAPRPGTQHTHRIYLKHMFLTESVHNLLPDWAFFIKCVINTSALRPTASREGFYEDDALSQTRTALGEALRGYLLDLRRNNPARLEQFINLHYRAIKLLAIDDTEFYEMIIDWLPFQTTAGHMMMSEIRHTHQTLYYVSNVDTFRQMAPLVSSQNMMLINAGYAFDEDLLVKLPSVFDDIHLERMEPTDFVQTFGEISFEAREEVFDLIKVADLVLQPFKCRAQVRRYHPESLPVIYLVNKDVDFLRTLEQSQETAKDHWSSILGALAENTHVETYAQLCFNYDNPLVRKLARMDNRQLLRMAIQMLYVQALTMGHHPLNAQEMALLNTGLIDLLDWSIDNTTPNLQ